MRDAAAPVAAAVNIRVQRAGGLVRLGREVQDRAKKPHRLGQCLLDRLSGVELGQGMIKNRAFQGNAAVHEKSQKDEVCK